MKGLEIEERRKEENLVMGKMRTSDGMEGEVKGINIEEGREEEGTLGWEICVPVMGLKGNKERWRVKGLQTEERKEKESIRMGTYYFR